MHGREYRLAVHHKVWLDRGDRFALGDGGAALFQAIEAMGSIQQAAREVGWSYRHALAYLNNAEAAFGIRLVHRERGGNERGGAALTPAARDFVRRYTRFRRRLDREVVRLYRSTFAGPPH